MSHGSRGRNLCAQKTKQSRLNTVIVYIIPNREVAKIYFIFTPGQSQEAAKRNAAGRLVLEFPEVPLFRLQRLVISLTILWSMKRLIWICGDTKLSKITLAQR